MIVSFILEVIALKSLTRKICNILVLSLIFVYFFVHKIKQFPWSFRERKNNQERKLKNRHNGKHIHTEDSYIVT